MNKSAGAVVLMLSLLVGVVPASAHPGGTEAAGRHAGSQPNHCHGGAGSPVRQRLLPIQRVYVIDPEGG